MNVNAISNVADQIGGSAPPLHRLALLLTEKCNIDCPYCYEHRDPEVFYHPDPTQRMMSEQSVIGILTRAYRLWPNIGALFFFGGEPLLKRQVIRRVCEAIDNDEIPGVAVRPRFAMITNGTLLDDDAIDLIQKYDFELNISLDGPPAVNDLTRITRRGKGTSDRTLGNLLRLRSRGLSYHIEATFSRHHLTAGVSVSDLMDYFYEEHGVTILHAPWVSATPDDPYYLSDDEIVAAYQPAIRYSLQNLRNGIPKVIFFVDHWLKVLQSYAPGNGRAYCPAFFSDISVNPAGDIYPCFMFNGYQYLKMGSVFDDDFHRNVNVPVANAFRHSIFGPCDCPREYQPFHSGCVGQDRIATNSILSKPYCGVNSRLLEFFLEELAEHQNSHIQPSVHGGCHVEPSSARVAERDSVKRH